MYRLMETASGEIIAVDWGKRYIQIYVSICVHVGVTAGSLFLRSYSSLIRHFWRFITLKHCGYSLYRHNTHLAQTMAYEMDIVQCKLTVLV